MTALHSASAHLSFSFDQSFDVRVIMRDGDPWFVAADVCAVLGIEKHRDALSKLDADERGSVKVDTLGGAQDMAAVNESGLYTLILRCRNATKPGTVPHRFRKWVTSEVLPSIRKTGSYQHAPLDAPVSLDVVNSADLHKLSQIVYLIRTNFHLEGSASHAAYAHLRKQFGLEKGIAQLPTIYLDQAIQILSELNRLSFAFKGIVLEAERQFFRQVLRAGNALDEDAFNTLFTAELAKMLDDHRDSLKLLN